MNSSSSNSNNDDDNSGPVLDFDIDFNITETNDDNGVSIDFDINLDESGVLAEDNNKLDLDWDINELTFENEALNEKNNSKKILKESILGDNKTRSLILNELLELKFFLSQRKKELESNQQSIQMIQQYIPSNIRQYDLSRVNTFLEQVTEILDFFNDDHFQLLLQIKTSQSYVDRLVNTMNTKLESSNRLEFLANESVNKSKEISQRPKKLLQQQSEMIKETKTIQIFLQNSISKLFKNRPVNIIGEINRL
eukprot:TRINITY_DN5553_c0_g1_i1.p1 TRINITY_DN5553_c0_g1~~TRINITY_DN5553_c0_g1_i1.p1  ORF type:complete len:252 (-),score=69.02 TRINITY_DN5553_c0_g1_i1:5-760(-)